MAAFLLRAYQGRGAIRTLRWIDKKLSSFETVMLVLLLGMMIVLQFLQVILRNFFESFTWSDQFLRYLVLWLMFFGAAQATHYQKHLNIDAFNKVLKESHKKVVSLIVNIVSLFIVVILAKGGWDYVLDSYEIGSKYILGIDLWMFLIIIPVGMILIGFLFFLHMLESALDIFGRNRK